MEEINSEMCYRDIFLIPFSLFGINLDETRCHHIILGFLQQRDTPLTASASGKQETNLRWSTKLQFLVFILFFCNCLKFCLLPWVMTGLGWVVLLSFVSERALGYTKNLVLLYVTELSQQHGAKTTSWGAGQAGKGQEPWQVLAHGLICKSLHLGNHFLQVITMEHPVIPATHDSHGSAEPSSRQLQPVAASGKHILIH